jgi:Skp family chaperone for outer membrane proteins
MKSFSICAGLAALAISFAVDGAMAASPAGPHILVIDRKALFTTTKLGENIRQQIMGYEQKVQSELGPENTALQKEIEAAGAKKSQALQAKEAAFQQKIRDRQSLVQGGQMAARKYFMDQIDAVVHAIMAEKGADVVLDKTSVVADSNGSDITKEAIARLDKKATSFKVPMVKPPLSEMLQMQQMQPGQ